MNYHACNPIPSLLGTAFHHYITVYVFGIIIFERSCLCDRLWRPVLPLRYENHLHIKKGPEDLIS
jgi:hypothetical protein